MIQPVPSNEQLEKITFPDVHPNVVRKSAGRPRKQRIRKAYEPKNPFKASRSGGYIVCGNCKQIEHNVRGYKVSITREIAWQRRMRLKKKNQQ